jgi:hypothetical protein
LAGRFGFFLFFLAQESGMDSVLFFCLSYMVKKEWQDEVECLARPLVWVCRVGLKLHVCMQAMAHACGLGADEHASYVSYTVSDSCTLNSCMHIEQMHHALGWCSGFVRRLG